MKTSTAWLFMVGGVVSIIGVILFVYGWINNIVILLHMTGPISGEEIIRAIGIFAAPLGAIAGYIN